MPSIALGAFTLERRIGRGGMGEVWAARHTDGTPAAVKLLTGELARTPEARRALQNEIRAVAALDHPAVVAIYDAGTADAEVERATGGRVVADSPWVAMELCSDGNLTACPPLDWAELRGLLVSLLDALGHIHARGVIHRDLKPENVLRAGPTDPRPGWRLADFGIAHALDRSAASDATTGTPLYMAPEQIRGERWRLGPVTDLFSLGCLAWEYACGRTHRTITSLTAVLQAQATEPLPPLDPAMRVPADLADWIDRLTQLDPGLRYQTAADAARALVALSGPMIGPEQAPTAPSRPIARTFALTALLEPLQLAQEPTSAPKAAEAPRLAFPEWRLASDEAAGVRLGNAGLGLLPWRTVPLVGRADVQEQLWAALGEVVQGGLPRAVWLRGPTGVGKSRMARWLVERAAELGVANPVTVRLGPRTDALADTLARSHGVSGLERDPALRLLRRQGVDPDQAIALVGWWQDGKGSVREHLGLAASRLAMLAGRRPVVLWLDDVHLDGELLGLVDRLHAAGTATLTVLTTDDEDAAGTEAEQALLARGDLVRIALGPLDGTERYALVHAALGLEPALGAEVGERSAGNPGSALTLVRELASRGALRWTEHGFARVEGAVLPTTDVGGTWAQRLASALDRSAPGVTTSVRAGALVGREVDPASWEAACAAIGANADPDELAPLVRAALVRVEPDGSWSFGHPALHEAASQGLEEPVRRAVHTALATRASDPATRARHLWAAGDLEGVLRPLVDEAEALVLEGRQKSALLRMERWSEAAEALGLAVDDPRRMLGLARLAAVRRQLGQLPEAEMLCLEVLDHGRPGTYAYAQATAELGAVTGIRGDAEGARAMLTLAQERFAEAGEPVLAEGCAVAVATALVVAGQRDRAREILESLELADPRGRARLERALGVLEMHSEQYEAAEARFRQALEHYRASGNLHGIANSWNDLAACAFFRGDHDAALIGFRAAAAQFDAMGAYQATQAHLNIAQIHAERGQWAEARARAAPLLARLQRTGTGDVALPQAVLLSVAAGLRDWNAFDAHLAGLHRDVVQAQHLTDLKMSAERAEAEARAAGEHRRADAARDWFAAVEERTRTGA